MTTESPMRMLESSGARNWRPTAATFASPFDVTAEDELGLLLKGHRFRGDQGKMAPNRSGSAPPSMEGSFAAFGNVLAQQSYNLSSSLASLSSAIENCESEEQLRSDPAYFAYYYSNVNLNPRLPPPIISRENRHLVRHLGGFDNSWRLTSFDDSVSKSMHLSTHEEEPEYDNSAQEAVHGWAESNRAFGYGQNVASLLGRHKSLVDLIQEDFPRTPSPVYTQSCSSSHATADEPIDRNVHSISLDDHSVNTSKLPESKPSSLDVCVDTCSELKSIDDPSVTSSQKELYYHETENSSASQKVEPIDNEPGFGDDELIGGASGLNTRIGALNLSSLFVVENNRNGQEHQSQENKEQQNLHDSTYQIQGAQAQVGSQGVNHLHSGMGRNPPGQPKFSSVEVQPILHPAGVTPPLYATAAAYMTSGNPFYPNLHHSGLYSPQYSMGGYALGSTFLPPFMAGYPSPAPVSMHLDATSSQSFSNRGVTVSNGESIPHISDLTHLNKFYGQHGLMMQPSFVDPLHMQYFQHPVEGVFGALGQYNQPASAGLIGGQIDSFVPHRESCVASYMGDQKFHSPSNGSLSLRTPRKGGLNGSSYHGSPSNLGVMSQFPASPFGSPTLPRSPVAGANLSGRRNEMKYQQGPFRNVGVYSGWQGQRGADSFNDPKKHYFLEELKSSSARKIDLSDIAGRIVELSVDQHGSRFIQQKLENCSLEEKTSVFKEVLPHVSRLMRDVFGNYVIQKFFEHGSHEQRKELADQLSGQMLPLSLQMYGCRVIQKALEVVELDQKTLLVHELDGHVMVCVQDQNGNHVIQKCIECMPTEKIGFIISAFRGQVATLSTHPYGCRVIQRVLEHCSEELQSHCIVDEILESAFVLAQDQYGNYVTQHVLERGKPHERSQIIGKLTGKIVQMSQHKYASNVVEKCLEYGDAAERKLLIEEILGQSGDTDNLLIMMKDQYANYVVQKILEISDDEQREVLLNRIKIHLQALKKYTYGKHIVTRFERLSGEDSQDLEL